MKQMSIKELMREKQSGATIRSLGPAKASEPNKPKIPTVEQSLATLNAQIKQLNLGKDNSDVTMQSVKYIASVLAKTVDKIDKMQVSSKPKNWSVSIQRDSDNLITSLKLKSI